MKVLPARQKSDDVSRKSRPDLPEARQRLRGELLAYLASHHVMTIASCRRNVPWAAAVFYANDDFLLYFLSHPKSRHGTNLAANGRVSAAIHEDYHDWGQIRGIQLEGRAERLKSVQQQAAFWKVYAKKFPFVKQFFRPGPFRRMVSGKVAGIRLYRIVPSALYFIDNSKGFGHRERLDLKAEDTLRAPRNL
ncbi:MAG TPA: pyridoxamine 5'-phosphate oxidase family protein [Terriglobia bacterium]|nr:pyridoxamine 5'-phosphate oxidase family protein [Terriglobia bacterium]